jgi:hypothetical protein
MKTCTIETPPNLGSIGWWAFWQDNRPVAFYWTGKGWVCNPARPREFLTLSVYRMGNFIGERAPGLPNGNSTASKPECGERAKPNSGKTRARKRRDELTR